MTDNQHPDQQADNPPLEQADETVNLNWCEEHQSHFPAMTRFGNLSHPGQCLQCAEAILDAAATDPTLRTIQSADTPKRLQIGLGKSRIPTRFHEYDFDSFPPISSKANDRDLAITLCRSYVNAWIDNRKRGANLIIIGNPGAGKTGLACAIAKAVINQGCTAYFTTAYGAVRKQRDTWGRKGATETEALAEMVDPDLLILDEVGLQMLGDNEMVLLFEVLNGRYAERRPTILLSNKPVEDYVLKGEKHAGLRSFLGDRLMDRMLSTESGIIKCSWPTLRKRVCHLKAVSPHAGEEIKKACDEPMK